MDSRETLSRRRLLQGTGSRRRRRAGQPCLRRPSTRPERRRQGHPHPGSLRQTTGPIGTLHRVLDINVLGSDSDLSGSGWDADPEARGRRSPQHLTVPSASSPSGVSVRGDEIQLMGKNLFWHLPGDDGAVITTTANLATGAIRWTTTQVHGRTGEAGTFVFEGAGVVART